MKKILKKRFVCALCAAVMVFSLFGCSGKTATSQTSGSTAPASTESTGTDFDWPKQPINILVPASAGGATDIIARILGEHITKKSGQPVVITNVSGVPAYEQGRTQEPNGYNFMVVMNHLFVGKASGTMDFDYTAFEGVSHFGTDYTTGLVVRSDSPYETLNDLIDAIKANPSGVIGGTSLSGYSLCVAMAMKDALGVDIYWVDSGSASDRSVALLGGQVDFISSNYTSVAPYLESNDFRFLAIPYEQRDPHIPDVPTFKECGYDFVFPGQDIYLAAPKGTDVAAINAMNSLINGIFEDPDFAEDVSNYSMVYQVMTPEEVNAGMAYATEAMSPYASVN